MTREPSDTGDGDPVDALVARAIDECGAVVTAELDPWNVDDMVRRLRRGLDTAFGDEFNGVALHMVLGSACTTAARTIEQFVAALQLPYGATRGWTDFGEALAERDAALPQR